MAAQNLETARRGYEHFVATGDVLEEIFHPDFVLDMSTFQGWPERPTYRGIDGLREFLADWLGSWDDYEFEVIDLREADAEVILGLLRQRGRSKVSGVPVDMELAQVLTYRDGKQIGTAMYASHAEGMAAVGLDP